MGDISADKLKVEVNAILKKADLSVMTGRKVREQLEKKLNMSLFARKKEIDGILMQLVDQAENKDSGASDGSASASQSSEENNSSSDEKYNTKTGGGGVSSAKKRPVTGSTSKSTPKNKKKRKSINAQDSGSESDGGSDSDYEVPKKQAVSSGKKKSGIGGKKSTGFTRAYNLSPELSALMGADSLPRHEVVKKVWAIIKDRNLYDPKNKQFAICDDDLVKVMKVKRFRTFGMLKHLKPHFLN